MEGYTLVLFPNRPVESALTRLVCPVWRSWTKTSRHPFESFGTRFVAKLANATKRPSAEMGQYFPV
jgi:hypothetical protein